VSDSKYYEEKQRRIAEREAFRELPRLRAEVERMRAVVEAARKVPQWRCFVTELSPEHWKDCACEAFDALDAAIAAVDEAEVKK
jgi:hypothetical protein